MLFGAGLTAGLLGQIAEAIGSDSLDDIVADRHAGRCRSRRSTRPGSRELTVDTVGFARLAIDLGPFGGAEPGSAGLWLWSLAYLVAVGAAAVAAFNRRDL